MALSLKLALKSTGSLLVTSVSGISVVAPFQPTYFFLIKTCFDPLFLILNFDFPFLSPNGFAGGVKPAVS